MARLKPNVPRSFHSLRESEKRVIEEAYEAAMDKEICDTQIIWIKMACMNLYDVLKSTEMKVDPIDVIYLFLGGWRRMYTYNSRLAGKTEQDAWLGKKINEIFGKQGFPEDFVESFRNIGR